MTFAELCSNPLICTFVHMGWGKWKLEQEYQYTGHPNPDGTARTMGYTRVYIRQCSVCGWTQRKADKIKV